MKQIIIAIAMVLSLGVSFVHAEEIDFDGKSKRVGVVVVVSIPAF